MGLPVDGRSDLFSAGVILYQFLTGERPFTGSATTTMQKVLKEDPLPPSRFNVQVPPRDGCRRAQGARQAPGRALPDRRRIRRCACAPPRPSAALSTRRPTLIAAADATLVAPTVRATDAVAQCDRAAPRHSPPPAAEPRASGRRPRKSQPSRLRSSSASPPRRDRWRRDGSAYRAVGRAATVTAGRSAPATVATGAGRAPPRQRPPPPAVAPKPTPGTMMISAVGLVDPSDPRYQRRQGADAERPARGLARASSSKRRSGCCVDTGSIAKNYDC